MECRCKERLTAACIFTCTNRSADLYWGFVMQKEKSKPLKKFIEIENGTQNNLKNVSVKIPLGKLTVVCGLSGSGKSSLAFETLYAEGQRRYLENLSNYVKQYISRQAKPQVERIENLPPALALEQKNNVRSRRSWVGTTSGVSDHLRLLFEKLGEPFCPKHKTTLKGWTAPSAADFLIERSPGERIFVAVPVAKENLTSEKEFLKMLKKQGFSRLLEPKPKSRKLTLDSFHVLRLEELKKLPSRDFFILIDRLVIDRSEKNRLAESFEQAFKMQLSSSAVSVSPEAAVIYGSEPLIWFSQAKQCSQCRYRFSHSLTASLFSFNSPLGACPACKGAGSRLETDEQKVIPNPKLSLEKGAVFPFTMPAAWNWEDQMKRFCQRQSIPWEKPWCNLPFHQRQQLWRGEGVWPGIDEYFEFLEGQKYKMHIRVLLSRFRSVVTCSKCQGTRLREEAHQVLYKGKLFNDYMCMSLKDLARFFKNNPFSSHELNFCEEVIERLKQKIQTLNSLGLSYLTLSRPVNTLSGGEFQRLNLASQLSMAFSQMLYVLDEPTVGLHPRDTHCMIEALEKLKKQGNTLVVVEHDSDIIEKGEFIVEMGPGAGHKGGQVVWSGSLEDFKKAESSNTSRWLNGKAGGKAIQRRSVNRDTYKFILSLKGCSGHNLKNLDFHLPLNRLVVVTGVSGSGKSSLIRQTLYPALREKLEKEVPYKSLPYDSLSGAQFLNDVLLLSQMDLKQSLRSSPASYIGIYSLIRFLFATEPLAVKNDLSASYFSVNVEKGRCTLCKGLGFQEIDMVFMDPISLVCEECFGKKFQGRVLDVRYKGKNIYEVLNLTVGQARHFFKSQGPILRGLAALEEVGLSYLALGQSLSSLSGGERQRLKLARELLDSTQMKTLYILDEPTKGLHFNEIDMLLKILQRLVDTGGSVLVVEHNMEVVKAADYIIDIGPEGGDRGGKIVVEGTPEAFLQSKKSHTARYLGRYLGAKY